MSRTRAATNLLACVILAVATLRVLAFWAMDPMPAYANNYDQIRTLRTFGLQPRDSPKEIYAATPEQPWRYFIQADSWNKPTYPSSDLAFKAIQYAAMATMAGRDGVMDIKAGTLPLLSGWLLCIWCIFRKLTTTPLAALGFAAWILLVADPVNLLFLNTWYAEFSAFACVTVFVGVVWLWLFDLVSLRAALIWGGACLALVSLNRNQYMFLLPAAALLTCTTLALSRWRSGQRLTPSRGTLVLVAAACLLPALLFGSGAGQLKQTTSANRIDTVFGALLPAASDPIRMLKHLGLPADCLRFSGHTWYSIPTAEYKAHCPKIMMLPLSKIAKAIARDPTPIPVILRNVAQHHRGFLQNHLGHIEGTAFSRIDGSAKPALRSLDPLLKDMSGSTANLVIWFFSLSPILAGLIAWSLKSSRWAFVFVLNGLLFNYALFSSVLGDGYIEVERHAILCFSFGTLFLALLAIFIASITTTQQTAGP